MVQKFKRRYYCNNSKMVF